LRSIGKQQKRTPLTEVLSATSEAQREAWLLYLEFLPQRIHLRNHFSVRLVPDVESRDGKIDVRLVPGLLGSVTERDVLAPPVTDGSEVIK